MLDRPDWVAASPADRIREIVLDDHTLSNREAALRARATVAQVERVRRQLIDVGLLMPRRVVPTRFPDLKQMPRSPRSLGQGSCVGRLPSLWVSDDCADRAEAVRICTQDCPVQPECLTWALDAVPVKDRAIYGGLTSAGRDTERRRRAGLPDPLWVTRSAANVPRAERLARQRARERQQQDGTGAA